jgi:hypothetical protein
MAIVLLTARRHATGYLWRVHLDDSKTVPDPEDPDGRLPDPGWVREWEFPGVPPDDGMTAARHEESQRAEVRLLAEHELDRMGGRGKKLAGEGEEL